MTNHEKDLVLAVVKHYMGQELRRRLMAEIPVAYNALVGRDVVVSTSPDGREFR